MKKLTTAEVAENLIRNQSAEVEADRVDYYLHLAADGTMLDAMYGAAVTFVHSVKVEEYGFTLEQWQDPESYQLEDVYDHESMDNPIFVAIVEDLTAQANAWIEEQEDDED